jgi:hypothetical protein
MHSSERILNNGGSMSLELQTAFFRNVNAFADQSNFFDFFRPCPIISSFTGLAEAALNTSLIIASLPVVLALQGVSYLPLPKETQDYVVNLAADCKQLLQKLMANVSLAVTSAIPFSGNQVYGWLVHQKNVIQDQGLRLQAATDRVGQLEKTVEDLTGECSTLRKKNEEYETRHTEHHRRVHSTDATGTLHRKKNQSDPAPSPAGDVKDTTVPKPTKVVTETPTSK